MKEQDIVEGNKLIAEFMGARWLKDDYETFGYTFSQPPTPILTKFYLLNALKYHSSWDWLMPVVEKINSLKEFDVIIWRNDCHVNDREEIIFETSRTKDEQLVSVVWRAVTQFLQLYKNRK